MTLSGQRTEPANSFVGQPVDVLVTTYKRPLSLERCLSALEKQTVEPNSVIVIHRSDDLLTQRALFRYRSTYRGTPRLVIQSVDKAGAIAALHQGFATSRTPFLALTDDDAAPRPDWLDRHMQVLIDKPWAGISCGPDRIPNRPAPTGAVVGRLTPWGRFIGRHEDGLGEVRRVDFFKGVNAVFRRSAVQIPPDGLLAGNGAQAHWEIFTSLAAKRAGFSVYYNPHAVVDHYPGGRFDEDDRTRPMPIAVRNAAYNLIISAAQAGQGMLLIATLSALLRGNTSNPGLLRALVAVLRFEKGVIHRFIPSCAGTTAAYRRARRTKHHG